MIESESSSIASNSSMPSTSVKSSSKVVENNGKLHQRSQIRHEMSRPKIFLMMMLLISSSHVANSQDDSSFEAGEPESKSPSFIR